MGFRQTPKPVKLRVQKPKNTKSAYIYIAEPSQSWISLFYSLCPRQFPIHHIVGYRQSRCLIIMANSVTASAEIEKTLSKEHETHSDPNDSDNDALDRHQTAKDAEKQDNNIQRIESEIVYPSGPKLVLIMASLYLAVFLIALDRTVSSLLTPQSILTWLIDNRYCNPFHNKRLQFFRRCRLVRQCIFTHVMRLSVNVWEVRVFRYFGGSR
jgi:hypothetical protein